MTTIQESALTSDPSVELQQEAAAPLHQPISATPTLSHVLSEIGSLPRGALFLGVASDGLPVLLNLHNPIAGPLLVVGDAGAGKTSFLQTLSHGIHQTQLSEDVKFGVITNHPNEWENIETASHRIGIFPVYHDNTPDFIRSLANWAHENHKSSQSILLLIDDLEAVAKLEPEVIQNLRWLLLRGPAHGVWPMVTMNAERYGQILAWISMFRTRVFARIENEIVAGALGGDHASAFNQLEAGVQFSLRENGNWLRFWLPSC